MKLKFAVAVLSFAFLAPLAQGAELSLTVNGERGEIIVPAEVNGRYLVSPTKHLLSFINGGNGEKSIMRALVSELDFHQALLDLGARPGDNMRIEDTRARSSAEGKTTEGDKISVYLTWDGSDGEISLDSAVVTEIAESRPLDLRFSGNLEFARKNRPGCFICLDSCPAGIVSNAAWPTGAINNREVSFHGNGRVLPPDGTRVSVVVRLVR